MCVEDAPKNFKRKPCVPNTAMVLSRPLGAFPKRQTEVAHSPRFLGVTVYVCTYVVRKTMKFNVLTMCDPVRVFIFGLDVPLGTPELL